MSSAASEDFSNILAEIRGFNAGILIAEQMLNKAGPKRYRQHLSQSYALARRCK